MLDKVKVYSEDPNACGRFFESLGSGEFVLRDRNRYVGYGFQLFVKLLNGATKTLELGSNATIE